MNESPDNPQRMTAEDAEKWGVKTRMHFRMPDEHTREEVDAKLASDAGRVLLLYKQNCIGMRAFGMLSIYDEVVCLENAVNQVVNGENPHA